MRTELILINPWIKKIYIRNLKFIVLHILLHKIIIMRQKWNKTTTAVSELNCLKSKTRKLKKIAALPFTLPDIIAMLISIFLKVSSSELTLKMLSLSVRINQMHNSFPALLRSGLTRRLRCVRMQGWGRGKSSHLIISTLGLFSPRKKWLLRSVLTTSLSTVNWTFLQNSLCSSGLMDNLKKYTNIASWD